MKKREEKRKRNDKKWVVTKVNELTRDKRWF
jgi:hypothetical protein